MAISNPGPGHSGTAGSLNSVPAPKKATLSSNYIDFTATATAGWAQQYLPDLMEKEAEVFGNRTISGFLSQVGAEEPMTSDQVVWLNKVDYTYHTLVLLITLMVLFLLLTTLMEILLLLILMVLELMIW